MPVPQAFHWDVRSMGTSVLDVMKTLGKLRAEQRIAHAHDVRALSDQVRDVLADLGAGRKRPVCRSRAAGAVKRGAGAHELDHTRNTIVQTSKTTGAAGEGLVGIDGLTPGVPDFMNGAHSSTFVFTAVVAVSPTSSITAVTLSPA